MKKILISLLMILSTPFTLWGQTYEVLWKQVKEAENKDLPKTQIKVLEKIRSKAAREKSYGNLLAAELLSSSLWTQISPDSAATQKEYLKKRVAESEKKDAVLGAVYNCALGRLFEFDESENKDDYYKKALEHPELLAQHKMSEFNPLIAKGTDDNIFANDLLHVIGMEVENYAALNRFYVARGNREAACYTALLMVRDKKDELSRLDSIIKLYGDLPICGEVAVRKYDVIKEDKTNKELIKFIDESLERWKSWQGIKALANERKELTNPTFGTKAIGAQIIAGKNDQKLFVDMRNIKDLTLTITRTKLDGSTTLNPEYNKELEKIKKELQPETQHVFKRTYSGHEAYEFFEDSIQLPALKEGVYLVKFESSTKNMPSIYRLLYSSNLFLMTEQQAKNKIRYVVVDASSGQPVPGAKLKLFFDERYKRKAYTEILTANKDGEAIFNIKEDRPYTVYVYTDKDRGCKIAGIYNNFSYSNYSVSNVTSRVFTDRVIYRPGQKVNVAAVVYHYSNSEQKTRVQAGQTFEIELRNANYEIVASNKVTTDRFGTASTSFDLPSSGLTGSFSVIAKIGLNGSASFNVEEYKRPTFEVTFDEYKEAYTAGDTIKLKGRAKSFAGVPVQNAKVHYTVNRQQAFWWWRSLDNDEQVFEDDVKTDAQGEFTVTLPFVIPEENSEYHYARFFNFEVNADVTDLAGESRQGYASLPLGTQPTAFSSNMKEKNLKDELKSVTFNYLNAAGKQLEGQVKYAIVPYADFKAKAPYKNYATAEANKPVQLKPMTSGRYHLHALCGKDTLDTDFYVFSLTDRRPVIETHDWFYATDSRFSNDGKPVYIQMGSTDANQHVVYSIYSGNKIIETGAFDQSNAITTRTFTYKEEYGDGITLNVAWVKDGELYRHSHSIARPLPDKRLLVKWRTFRNKLTPGQKEEWTVTIQRPDGKAADAQLMATLYDKSLDQILAHSWSLSPSFYDNIPQTSWNTYYRQMLNVSYSANISYQSVGNLSFAGFDVRFLDGFESESGFRYGYIDRQLQGNLAGITVNAYAPMKDVAYDSVESNEDFKKSEDAYETRAKIKFTAPVIKKDEVQKSDTKLKKDVQLRENLNETAFFYPQLQTDSEGNISIKFTLPESLTTWRFIGVAHDEDLNNGAIEDEVVAQKTVMVQPNIPRFVRRGDAATISSRLFNTSDKEVKGTCTLELIDPETDTVVYSENKQVVITAQGSASETFSIAKLLDNYSQTLSADQSLLIARISIVGDNYSDGEQRYLPILPNMEFVTNTHPFTQNQPGIETIDLTKLFPKRTTGQRLTVEYTNNPAWLMIQALPYVAYNYSNNAVSLSSAYYANKLAEKILKASPEIKETILQWKQEKGAETSMMSALQKNQELKELVLNETPWVADANNEAKQKQNLMQFFDENSIRNQLSTTLNEIKKLQKPDGAFSWYCDMLPSFYMTITVVKTLARLQILTGESESGVTSIINSSFRYLDKEVARQVKEMKKNEKKYKYTAIPSDELCNYVYINALLKRPETADISYLVDRISKKPTELTIYGKALTAVILKQHNKTAKAMEYLQSIKEYTVYNEEKGRYFDSRNAYYSWRDYKIPTEVAAIEALKLITPTDRQTIEEMQRWLLQEKRTQAWDTPLNSVDAVWAFMNDGKWSIDNGPQSVLKIDGSILETPKATAGLGYVKTVRSIDQNQKLVKTFTVEKTSTGTSWGAVYAQFFQPVTEVAEAAAGLKVKREILTEKKTDQLKVGDKIVIRLTITADRDYDFVQLIDKRAACLEPLNQISGYHWGYYIAPKDYTTNYYFDLMAKGKHIIETEYFVDREGTYQTGICTVQCAYSPEYSGRTGAVKFNVDK